ncbi:MAG: hypothetical protein JJE45_02765 [Prolixibacteraceae bacterium]|nr:hypothetical protein [Prolixibacteraceae bacterium]
MILKIILVISIILQLFAVSVAIKLTKVTKYNFSWMLLTVGFILTEISLIIQFLPYISNFKPNEIGQHIIWLGVIKALCFAIGVFMIQKIFKYMKKVEDSRRLTEKMFLNAVIQAEEKERKRFANELHDGLGPLLSTIKMSFSALVQNEPEKFSGEIVDNTEIVINEAIKTLKEISNNLSPHVLTNFGLYRALRNFINKINALRTITINLDSNLGNKRYDTNIEIVLYRVICELIHNTVKHAEAKKIDISLMEDGKNITIAYKDNGKGFDPEKLKKQTGSKGIGLSNIFSRINSLKGEFTLDSHPGKGIYVFIKVKKDE